MKPVPTHQVPGRSPEPDWDRYYDLCFEIVHRMVPSMDDTLLRDSWSRELDLFFIDRKFNRLRGNVRRAYDQLRAMVDPEQVPSYNDINALTEGEAISLLSTCRLRYCLEVARRQHNEMIQYLFALEDKGIPIVPGKVIPSINVFDTERYRAVKSDLGIGHGELTAHASHLIHRTLNPELFEVALEQGCSAGQLGQSKGFYRLTDHMANAIYSFLQEKAAAKGYQLRSSNYYFPRNPTHGPGNGKWCKSLRRNHGNYWPSDREP